MFRVVIPLFALALVLPGSVRALDISAEHPAFVFPIPEPLAQTPGAYTESVTGFWAGLSEFFQAHSALHIPYQSGLPQDRIDKLNAILTPLKDSGVPLAITIARGPDYEFLRADAIDDLLRTHPSVQLLRVDRLRLDAAPDYGDLSAMVMEPIAAWLEQIVAVAKDRNVQLVIELDGLVPIKLMSDPRYEAAYRAMAEASDSVILTYRQGGFHSMTGNAALVGLWLEGAAGHWGMALDSSDYLLSGLISPGQMGINIFGASMPASVYRAWILLGAMTGAEIYWFHRPDEMWDGAQKRYWEQVIAPTLLQITRKAYIARKDLVSREAAVGYRLNAAIDAESLSANLNDVDPVFHRGELFQAAYSVIPAASTPEWIANAGDFFVVPILSPYASDDALFTFKEVFTPGTGLNVNAWRERLREYYPGTESSEAYVHKVGRAIFVFHSAENSYGPQRYSVDGGPSPLYDITATREGNTVTVAWPFREGDVSYSVYRAVDPPMDALTPEMFEEIATGIDVRTYVDEDVPPGSTVLYSATAITNENAPISGVVDFGEYKIVSAVESRVDGFAFIEPYTMRSRSVNGFGTPDPSAEPLQENWSSIPKDADEHVRRAYGNIEAVLAKLGTALQDGNIDEAMTCFTDDYSNGEAGNRASLRGILKALVNTRRIGPVQFQVQEWNRNDFEFSGEIITTTFARILTLDRRTMTTQSIPSPLETQLRILFHEDFNGNWQIKRIEPALIAVTDLLGDAEGMDDV